jgi:hypothetical protein
MLIVSRPRIKHQGVCLKHIIVSLLIALGSTAQAERVFVQSAPHPQTGRVLSYSFESEFVNVAQGTAMASVTDDDPANPPIWFIQSCKPGTKGGVYDIHSKTAPHSAGMWMVGGSTIADGIATKVCYHALKNTGAVK